MSSVQRSFPFTSTDTPAAYRQSRDPVKEDSGTSARVGVEEVEHDAGRVNDTRVMSGLRAGPLVWPAGDGPQLDVAPGGASVPARDGQPLVRMFGCRRGIAAVTL